MAAAPDTAERNPVGRPVLWLRLWVCGQIRQGLTRGPAAPLTNPAPGCGSGVLWRLSHEKPLVQDLLLEVALPPHASAAVVGWIDLATADLSSQARD